MWEIIKSLGIFTIGSVSIVGVIGFIFKMYFEHYLQNRSEEFKLTAQLLLNERQIKYSKLHAERGEIIKDLYSHLLDYNLSIESYLILLSFGGDESKRKDAENYWLEKMLGFEKIYKKNRIFFSSSFCELADNLREEINSINLQISSYLNKHNLYQLSISNSPEKIEYIKLIEKAKNDIPLKVTPLLRQLENEFRELLGV